MYSQCIGCRAGLAIRRHIRTAARERAERQRPPAKIVIERELRQKLRAEQMEKGFFGKLSDPQPSRQSISKTRQALRESGMHAAVTVISEPAREAARAPEPAEPINETPAVNEFRKPPVSISDERFERLDLGHFNKDLGDLSDPYQIPRAAGRNRS